MKAIEWASAAEKARMKYVEAAELVAKTGRGAEALPALATEAARTEYEGRKQLARETWSEWRPAHASHVVGRWTQRVFGDDGMPEEQKIVITCEHCKHEHKMGCTSGLVQSHVQRFAFVHLHRDVFHVRPRKVE